MEILNSRIERYLVNLLPERNDIFHKMERYAAENDFPIVGPLCGSFLQQMARATGAKNVFEMGSGYGYSALWLAGGMPDDGKIICTDGNLKNKERAQTYFESAGVSHKIDFQVGMAQKILEHTSGPFDIIFNDIDKHEYPDIIELVVSKLRPGGLFITDNALWGGSVVEAADDVYSKGVQEFNRIIFERTDLLTTIVPLRDGLAVCVKL